MREAGRVRLRLQSLGGVCRPLLPAIRPNPALQDEPRIPESYGKMLV